MTIRRAPLPFCLFFLLMAVAPATSQVGFSEISGEVRDPSGALVAGAKVTAEATQTGDVSRIETTSAGYYLFSNLRPGSYSVSAEAPGFRQAIHQDVQISVGDRRRVDFSLVVGSSSEQVTVTSQPASLEHRNQRTQPGR